MNYSFLQVAITDHKVCHPLDWFSFQVLSIGETLELIDDSPLENCICSQLATFALAFIRQQIWPFIHMRASSCTENSYNFLFEESDNLILDII